jgi:hypothetical protein
MRVDVMPVTRSRHRDVGASGVRAAVLGAGDGLLTNVSPPHPNDPALVDG